MPTATPTSTTPIAAPARFSTPLPTVNVGKRLAVVEEPDKHIVRIEWDSAEGHLQGFRKSPDFKPFLDATGPFFSNIQEMTHYEVTLGG